MHGCKVCRNVSPAELRSRSANRKVFSIGRHRAQLLTNGFVVYPLHVADVIQRSPCIAVLTIYLQQSTIFSSISGKDHKTLTYCISNMFSRPPVSLEVVIKLR